MIKRKRACVALRDTLLPRLISGQLRLPEVQALAQEAMKPKIISVSDL